MMTYILYLCVIFSVHGMKPVVQEPPKVDNEVVIEDVDDEEKKEIIMNEIMHLYTQYVALNEARKVLLKEIERLFLQSHKELI